jgi:hypothetical protein
MTIEKGELLTIKDQRILTGEVNGYRVEFGGCPYVIASFLTFDMKHGAPIKIMFFGDAEEDELEALAVSLDNCFSERKTALEDGK